MDQPCEVETKLLAIIVFDEVEWLHICNEALGYHTPWKSYAVFIPRLLDFFTLGHVHWEVFKNNTTLTHVVHIYFLLKSLPNDCLMLAAIELVKLITSIAQKRLGTVVLGQTTLNFEDLTHQINDRVIEIDDNDQGIRTSSFRCLIEVFRFLNVIENWVVNSTTFD